MKTKNIPLMRHAIAMIELIFAIVIIGITLLSTPMLINQSTQGTYTALQQESIAAAATQINIIMSAEWDAGDTNSTMGSPILTTTSTLGIATCPNRIPIGVTSITGRYCDRNDINGTTITSSVNLQTEGVEGTFYDDIDDYNGQSYIVRVFRNETYNTTQGDYIDNNITMNSRIVYGDDLPRNTTNVGGAFQQTTTFDNPFRNIITNPNTSNIKLITVRLSSVSPSNELNDKNITLSAFMCNIGSPARYNKFITNRPLP